MNSEGSNYEFKRYLSARSDFAQGRYKLAIKKLKSFNPVIKNDDVNHLLVKSLYRSGDYRSAERVALDDVNSYTTTVKATKTLINVLLKNREFIICREIINAFNDYKLRQKLLNWVDHAEDLYRGRHPGQIHSLARRFYHLSDLSLIKQRFLFRKAQRLPKREFIEIAKTLLVDPFLSPIMRLTVLDTIRKAGLKLNLKYRWVDHKIYKIETDKLPSLTATSSYCQTMRVIKDRYFHDLNRKLLLEQMLRLDLSYLYPFNDQVVKTPRLWVRVAQLRIKGEQPNFSNSRMKSIYLWQLTLARLTANLVK